MKESEEKVFSLNNEKELLLKQTDHALQEAHFWRSELGKARERAVILEASVVRADERARISQVNAEAKFKDSAEKELVAAKEKEELLNYVKNLQSQIQRFNFSSLPDSHDYFRFYCHLMFYPSY